MVRVKNSRGGATAVASASVSFPIAGLLGVAFIVLKLMGYITWSWLWVLAPFWAPLALGVAAIVLIFAVAGILHLIGKVIS